LKFLLPPPLDIPVIIRTHFAKPQQCIISGPNRQTRTTDCSEFPAAVVEVISQDGRGAGSARFMPDPDVNNLKVKGIMPGSYLVRVTPRGAGYVASASCGATNLLRDPLIVPEGGSLPAIDIELRDDAAALKLRLNSAVANKAWAVLLPDLFGRDPVVLDLSPGVDRDYTGLAPGDYQVLAFDSMNGIDPNSPELLEKYAGKAMRVSLPANGSTTVSLDLVKTGE
jgi:hypothetical protein